MLRRLATNTYLPHLFAYSLSLPPTLIFAFSQPPSYADDQYPAHSPDLIAFIYVFSETLRGLVHKKAVNGHKCGITKVMDKLVVERVPFLST